MATGITVGAIGFSKDSSANKEAIEQKIPALDASSKPLYSKKLTLNAVKELSKQGDRLSWEDFEEYDYEEGDSGIYIRFYDIDEDFHLSIGSHGWETDEKPFYIYLSKIGDEDSYIDIRTENVEDFIAKYSR